MEAVLVYFWTKNQKCKHRSSFQRKQLEVGVVLKVYGVKLCLDFQSPSMKNLKTLLQSIKEDSRFCSLLSRKLTNSRKETRFYLYPWRHQESCNGNDFHLFHRSSQFIFLADLLGMVHETDRCRVTQQICHDWRLSWSAISLEVSQIVGWRCSR